LKTEKVRLVVTGGSFT